MSLSIENILSGFDQVKRLMQQSTEQAARGCSFGAIYVHITQDHVEAGARQGRASFSQMTRVVRQVLNDRSVDHTKKVDVLQVYKGIVSSYESKIEKWGFLPHFFPFLFGQIREVKVAHQFIDQRLEELKKMSRSDWVGEGSFVDEEGTLYQGYFDKGYLKGGTATTRDGMILKGNFDLLGRMQGEGEVVIDGALFYKGFFVDDKPRGEGTAYLMNGKGGESRIIQGEFKGGLRGSGVITYASGAIYRGEFEEGKEEGIGELKDAEGNVYRGRFRDGKFLEEVGRKPHGS